MNRPWIGIWICWRDADAIVIDSCTCLAAVSVAQPFQPGPTTTPTWWWLHQQCHTKLMGLILDLIWFADVVFAQCKLITTIYIWLYIYHIFLKMLNCWPLINWTWFTDVHQCSPFLYLKSLVMKSDSLEAKDLSWPSAEELRKCEEIRKNCAATRLRLWTQDVFQM